MAPKKTGKHKLLKWTALTLGLLIVLITIAAFYLSAKWKPLLTEKIKEGVYEGSGHLYRIDFKDIRLNLLTGTAAFAQVSLKPDTAVFRQLNAAGRAPVHLFELKLEKLQLNRIGVLTTYFKKKVEMNSIVLDHPSINVTHYQRTKPKDTIKDDRTLYQQLSKTLRSVHVKTIRIADADFDYISGATGKPLHTVKHLSIQVSDLLIDSLSQYDTTRFYYTKDLAFELTGYRSVSKNKMYTMKIDTIKGSATAKTIRVKGFQMIPMYPDLQFSRKYTYGKDRYDLKFDEISLRGVDYARINTEGSLYARALKIGPAKAGIFVNRELPPPPNFDKVRNFPHVAVRRIPMPAIIDSVIISNVDVAYTEYNPISEKKGTVYFQHLSGTIRNVTNDSLRLAGNNHATATLSALVMKTSRINVAMDFNLTDKLASFSYKGSVAPMNMQVLNPMTKNMGLVEIESGKMQSADFDIKANSLGSSGTVRFLYTDLKIKLLKEGEDGAAPKKKGLLSFLANTLLIKDNNPEKGKAPRVAHITFSRTPAASFFNQMWKGVFIGLRETAGLGMVPVKTPEQAMKKVKEKLKEDN